MTWEEQYQSWRAAQSDISSDLSERIILSETRKECHSGCQLDTQEAQHWIESALADPERKWFVAAVLNSRAAPRRLAKKFLEMGVLEQNPSSNSWLIESAVRALGAKAVFSALLRYLRHGTDTEKAGAASAFYWIRDDGNDPGCREIVSEIKDELLRVFVVAGSLNVRRRILPLLSMRADAYSKSVRPLVKQAIKIARNHPDEYIRHRIEVQLGASRPFKPLP